MTDMRSWEIVEAQRSSTDAAHRSPNLFIADGIEPSGGIPTVRFVVADSRHGPLRRHMCIQHQETGLGRAGMVSRSLLELADRDGRASGSVGTKAEWLRYADPLPKTCLSVK